MDQSIVMFGLVFRKLMPSDRFLSAVFFSVSFSFWNLSFDVVGPHHWQLSHLVALLATMFYGIGCDAAIIYVNKIDKLDVCMGTWCVRQIFLKWAAVLHRYHISIQIISLFLLCSALSFLVLSLFADRVWKVNESSEKIEREREKITWNWMSSSFYRTFLILSNDLD